MTGTPPTVVGQAPALPTVTVLCADHRPHGMGEIESSADVRYATAAGLADALRGADALFVWNFLSTAVAEAWQAADRVRWVHVASAGVDPLLFPDLVRSRVTLTNSRGVFDRPVAEYVLGLVLALAKDMPTTVDLQRRRAWCHRETERVEGRTALVVGTGPIGRETARLLRAVGMTVLGVGRRPRPYDQDLGVVHGAGSLDDLLPEADVVVLAAPLTEQTRGMVDARRLGLMRPTARLVNVGRGPLVVEEDLLDALRGGQIAGAALDVFGTEPLPADHELWTAPGLVVSPHMSGDVVGWRDALVELFVTNYRRWRAGEPLLNVVDKNLGYVPVD